MTLTRFRTAADPRPGEAGTASEAPPALHVVTFGCQMNKYDSLLVEGRFKKRGYRLTERVEEADVVLFNTCSVRDHAEERAWSWLGELKREKEQMLAKKANAEARIQIQETLDGLSTDADVKALDNVREHISKLQAEADIGSEIQGESLDAKLAKMKSLGAGETINYRNTPDWDAAVLEMTGGVGVDRVVEVGGPGTFDKSVNAVRVGGVVGLIGILTGVAGQASPTAIMRKSVTVRGVYVGSRAMFADMNRAITVHDLKPVIDQTFAFEDAKAAYHTMRGAGHFGKLVIDFAA